MLRLFVCGVCVWAKCEMLTVKWYWCWCWWWCDDMRPTKIWEIMCELLASLRLFSLMTLNSYEWEVSYECVGSSLWSLSYAHLHTMVGAVYRVPGVINILHYSHFNRALCMRYLWFESHTLFLFMNHFYRTLSLSLSSELSVLHVTVTIYVFCMAWGEYTACKWISPAGIWMLFWFSFGGTQTHTPSDWSIGRKGSLNVFHSEQKFINTLQPNTPSNTY